MILDKGISSIYSVGNSAAAGNAPVAALSLKYQSWYGELEFATTPYNTGLGEDVTIDARIRIVQNREVSPHDVAVVGGRQYEILRAFHGTDSESGQPITDLTLQKVVQKYDLN